MLRHLSRESNSQSAPEPDSELIPDPWEISNPTPKPHSTDRVWKLPTEPHLLIGPTGNPKAIRLPARTKALQMSAVQVILQDELKLRAAEKLTLQIRDALVLLCWMGKGNPAIA